MSDIMIDNTIRPASGGSAADDSLQQDFSGSVWQEDMTDCCNAKHKVRNEAEKKDLTTRLSRIEGQIRGIRKMIEDDRYCVDVLMQVSAVQSALNAFNRQLLSSHIKSCVVDDIKSGNDAAVDELCELLKKTMK